jgi:hypothetical protein
MRSMTIFSLAMVMLSGCGRHEPAVTLGAQALPGYHVLAGSATVIPGGDIAYAVTANGQGGYQLSFIDTQGSPSRFDATISTDGLFDPRQTVGLTGAESVQLVGGNTIAVSGVPGATLEGVSFVSSSDPIYVDGRIDGSRGVAIYFTGAHTGAIEISSFNPVAFTSP